MTVPVVLATEDALSEAVGLCLLKEHKIFSQEHPMMLRKNGYGYLRARMKNWRQMAQRQVVMVLTDLDRVTCPIILLNDWLDVCRPTPDNLIFRIAEREVESWLLADHQAFSQLMGSKAKLPKSPDTLLDPKEYLLEQAKRAPREIREDLLAKKGTMAKQGLGYNARLVRWVEREWSPQRAAELSPSLARARLALSQAAKRIARVTQ